MEQNNQIAVIQNSIEIFKTAPEILKANQDRTAKALNVGNDIINQWNIAWKIENEDDKLAALAAIDERSNKYLVNCNTALKEEKETRAAITQLMDEFKKMFTSAENEIDRTKVNSVPQIVQNNRDEYAKEAHRIAEEKRKQAEFEAAQKSEAINIKSNIEVNLKSQFNKYLLDRKKAYTDSFNAITLSDYEDKSIKLKALKPTYKFEPTSLCSISYSKHSSQEIELFSKDITEQFTSEFEATFNAEVQDTINELIEKLPSKLNELQEQKRLADEAAEAKRLADEAADLEEKKRLQALAEKAEQDKKDAAEAQRLREEQDALKMQEEAANKQKEAEQEAEIKKQGEHTMTMFEKEAAIADAVTAPPVRQGFEIIVTHQAGWVQLFQLWFENEGKNLPIDKIGNTKLDQMKSWAEKHAHKTGTKIESKFINYQESFKAVNKK